MGMGVSAQALWTLATGCWVIFFCYALSGSLGKRVEALYDILNSNMHLFDQNLGLVLRKGVPDPASAQLLKCIAEAYGVNVVEVGSSASLSTCQP
jgi:hypothetical protein